MERSQLRQLHVSQLEAYKSSIDEKELTSLLRIGLKQSTAENLQMFGDQIMDDAARVNGGDSLLTPGVLLGSTSSRRGPKRSFKKHPVGRNIRARTGDSSTWARSSASSPYASTAFPQTPSTSVSMDVGRLPIVKKEPNEDDLLPRGERVQIFLGPNNTEFTCSKVNIAKSPVLWAYVVERAGQQSYIMNPALKDVSPDDFGCVIDFLRTNMFAPALFDAPVSRSDQRKYVLDGVTHEWEYISEIQRCGRLHVLAKKFQILSLVDYIFTRLTDVRYPTPVVRGGTLLELTKTVFCGKGRKVNTALQCREQEGALERWLIEKIVERLETITTGRDSSKLFWEVMRAGKSRELAVKVFRGRAEQEEKFPDLIEIEDD